MKFSHDNPKSLFFRKGILAFLGIAILIIAVLVGAGGFVAGNNGYRLTNMVIETAQGDVTYNVEIANTMEQKAVGLMHREHMPTDQGMVFLEEGGRPRMISMWMRNTYIPLDMVFINSKGHIVHIHENAIPMDETSISSLMPAIAVLEINAGQAHKNGIKIGNQIRNIDIFFKNTAEMKKALE